VTSLVFCDRVHGSGDENLLITGSWDKVGFSDHGSQKGRLLEKTIKVWDTDVSTHASCGLSPVSHTRPLQVQSRDLINSGTHGFRQDTSHRAISSAARVWQLGQVCAILVSSILTPVFFFFLAVHLLKMLYMNTPLGIYPHPSRQMDYPPLAPYPHIAGRSSP
jgi:hypothetical protein